MASSPQFKIYSPTKEYVAACKYASDAAALVSLYGKGATVRYGHSVIVWTEGSEIVFAAESYDRAGSIMYERVQAKHEAVFAKYRRKEG